MIPVSYVKSDFMFGIYSNIWVIRLVRVGPGFYGPSYGSVRGFGPGRLDPVRGSGIPDRTANSVHKNPGQPGPSLYDPTFCVDSESEVRFDVAHRNHELEGHFGQNGPVR